MSRSAAILIVGLMLALPALTGCPSSTVPSLSVYPGAFDFGASGTTDGFTVSSLGGGTLPWAVEGLPAWLNASPMTGTATSGGQLVTLTANRTGLAAGEYTGEFRVVSGAQSMTVSAHLAVEGEIPAPVLEVSPAGLNFGTTTDSLTATVNNGGTGTLEWTLTEDIAWLEASPVSGEVADGATPDTVTATVNRSSLAPGTYTGNLEFTSNGGTRTVPVSMEVLSDVPVMSVSPLTLEFGAGETELTFAVTTPQIAPPMSC